MGIPSENSAPNDIVRHPSIGITRYESPPSGCRTEDFGGGIAPSELREDGFAALAELDFLVFDYVQNPLAREARLECLFQVTHEVFCVNSATYCELRKKQVERVAFGLLGSFLPRCAGKIFAL